MIQDKPSVILQERLAALEGPTTSRDNFRETLKSLASIQIPVETATPLSSRIKMAAPISLDSPSKTYSSLASVLSETTRFEKTNSMIGGM